MVYDGHNGDETVEVQSSINVMAGTTSSHPLAECRRAGNWCCAPRNIYGPYERRVTLEKGDTSVNGPHQGAWVDTPTGQSWFVHFQDKGAYGRVVHLQPMTWEHDWPVMGDAGRPVLTARKPDVGANYPVMTPAESDEFNQPALGLQWQWQANPRSGWAFPAPAYGVLRLFSVPAPEGLVNLWQVPNLLLQKFPAPAFAATAKLTFTPRADGDRTGLLVMGTDYAWIGLRRRGEVTELVQVRCLGADTGGIEAGHGDVTLRGSDYLPAGYGCRGSTGCLRVFRGREILYPRSAPRSRPSPAGG